LGIALAQTYFSRIIIPFKPSSDMELPYIVVHVIESAIVSSGFSVKNIG
jgi:hypothetical protein